MKVAKEEVRSVGLTTLYQPDDPSDIGFDIIFVHGLGGHPVQTWLHTQTIAHALSKSPVIPTNIARPARSKASRSSYLVGDLVSHGKDRGNNVLKKRHSGILPRLPESQALDLPPRPQTADQKTHKAGPYSRPTTLGSLVPSQPPARSKSTFTAPPTVQEACIEEVKQSDFADKETYWPMELLPESCPSARISTYGFETHVINGQLSPGQPDILARGGELLEAMHELRRRSEASRDMVFVAHSTGGIVVKEMLRLASSLLDSDGEGEALLASVASVIFMSCPLRGTDYGSIVIAMKSMAAATTGVAVNDSVLGKMLGGNGDSSLPFLGCDAFEALWRRYDFRVKVYRETIIEPPSHPWAELGLALRRDASTLANNREQDDDILGDHTSMCKFANQRDERYQLVSSYMSRLAHYQSLKVKRQYPSERETKIQQSLVDSGASGLGSRRLSASSSTAHTDTRWLLQYPTLQRRRRRSQVEDMHKLLWLTGPPGAQISGLLSSLQALIAQRWAASEPHSSVIVTITADQAVVRVDSVLFNDSYPTDSNGVNRNNEIQNRKIDEKTASKSNSSQASTHETAQVIPLGISSTPVRTLRSLLSQLCAHDPRLQNLVRKTAATAGTLHDDDDVGLLVETLFPSSDFAHHTSQHHHVSNNHSTTRRWSDPTDNTPHLLWGDCHRAEAQDRENSVSSGKLLDDADVGALLLKDYLRPGPPQQRRQGNQSGSEQSNDGDADNADNADDDDDDDDLSKVGISSLTRVFCLVNAARVVGDKYLSGLLWCLSQLARRSEFTVCVISTATMANPPYRSASSRTAKSPSDSALLLQVPEENADEIRQYLDTHLAPDMEERQAIAAKMLDRAGGVLLWAEMVTAIVNEASEEGVSGEIVLSMLDDIAPRRSNGGAVLDGLYAWKLRRLGSVEQAQALVVMQWVILTPEPLRLNELLIALRLTLLACRRGGHNTNKNNDTAEGKLWDTRQTFEVGPAMSLKELRAADGDDDRGIGSAMDSPTQFWKWLQQLSQGMLRLESAEGNTDSTSISREPLGLQRVRPADDSVQRFFLKGTGFQTLLAAPNTNKNDQQDTPLPSTDRFIDTAYHTLLHVCFLYLNMTELDALGREKPPVNPAPGSALPPEETSKWRAHADVQRRMVMASYPFLRYAVDHLVFHLLCPRAFRYFLPQGALLALLSANRCRIWRRWTHLLGFSIADAAPEAVLARVSSGPAGRLLAPVYGARYRLERVLRRVWRLAVEQLGQGSAGTPKGATPKKGHSRARSDVSEGSVVFMLMGGEDPLKASWMVPTSPSRRREVEEGRGRGRGPESPRALVGIQEKGGAT